MCKIGSQEKRIAYKLKRRENKKEADKKDAEEVRKIQRDALLEVIK